MIKYLDLGYLSSCWFVVVVHKVMGRCDLKWHSPTSALLQISVLKQKRPYQMWHCKTPYYSEALSIAVCVCVGVWGWQRLDCSWDNLPCCVEKCSIMETAGTIPWPLNLSQGLMKWWTLWLNIYQIHAHLTSVWLFDGHCKVKDVHYKQQPLWSSAITHSIRLHDT